MDTSSDYESDFEPEDLSNLPVIKLAPLSKYRVGPRRQCPNQQDSDTFLSKEAVENGAVRGCPACICAYNEFIIYEECFVVSDYRFANYHNRKTLFQPSRYMQICLDYYTVGGWYT